MLTGFPKFSLRMYSFGKHFLLLGGTFLLMKKLMTYLDTLTMFNNGSRFKIALRYSRKGAIDNTELNL